MTNCPKCDKELVPTAKFCTSCGALISMAQQISNFKINKTGYFDWFTSTILHPASTQKAGKYYGLISVLISMVLIVSSLMLGLIPILNSISWLVDVSFGSFQEMFMIMFIPLGIIMGAQLIWGYFFYVHTSEDNIDIFQFINRFSVMTNGIIILGLGLNVFALFMMSSSDITQSAFIMTIALVLSNLMVIFWQTGYTMVFAFAKIKAQYDKIRVVLVAVLSSYLVLGLTVFVLHFIFNSMTGHH